MSVASFEGLLEDKAKDLVIVKTLRPLCVCYTPIFIILEKIED